MFLAGGAAQLLLTIGLWLTELAARTSGVSLPWKLPAAAAHAFMMIYGVFPYFVLGFLFTVYPRWLHTPPIERRHYLRIFALLNSGWLLLYLGFFVARVLAALAVLLLLLGCLHALTVLLNVYGQARERGVHERLLNFALVFAVLGHAAFLYGIVRNDIVGYLLARELGLWLFLVPVVFTVSHRMIPFFSSSVLMNYVMVRPAWGPPLMLLCVAGHAVCELAGVPQWRWIADFPLAITALHHSYVWKFRRSFHSRMLAMLHIAFLWLGVAMLLYALQSLLWLATGSDWMGRAPLHALGIGFLASMVVAMGSRVTLGHAGLSMVADRLTWFALLGLSITAVLRIAAEFSLPWANTLNIAAGGAWLLCIIPWVLKYAPIYLLPRPNA